MGDMGDRHQHAVRANLGDAASGGRSPVNGAMFPDLRPSANVTPGWFAFVFKILRRHTNGAERKQDHARSDPRVTVNHDMGNQLSSVFDHDIRANRAKRPNPHIPPQFSRGINQRGGVDRDTQRPWESDVRHRIHS